MKKFKHLLISMLLLSFIGIGNSWAFGVDGVDTFGDTHPPFPLDQAEPCAILADDLPGFWVAKDESGQGLFYIHIVVREVEGLNYILFRQYIPVIDKHGFVQFVLSTRGHGNLSTDQSSVTGVLVDREKGGKSNWIYIHSLCDLDSGQRQTILEIVPTKDGRGVDGSEKYIFEKVPDDTKISFTD